MTESKNNTTSEKEQDLMSKITDELNGVAAEAENAEVETKTLAEDFSEEISEEKTESDAEVFANGFDNCTVADLYALSEQFPDENVAQDIISESFRIFAKGRNGEPENIYSEFLDLRRSFEKGLSEKNPARGLSGQEKSTRAYSGFDGAGIYRNASAGLTKRQMQIARDSGMSFREYAELLDSVPHGRNL